MSYGIDDRAAFLRAERDYLTPRDERVSDDELSEMSREIDAAEAREDIGRGSYFTPGVTQATGALEPCETCPPLDPSLCDDCVLGDEPTCPACYAARSEHTPQMLRACAAVLARLAAFERLQNVGAA